MREWPWSPRPGTIVLSTGSQLPVRMMLIIAEKHGGAFPTIGQAAGGIEPTTKDPTSSLRPHTLVA